MKIYNYSDAPITINGHNVDDVEVQLPQGHFVFQGNNYSQKISNEQIEYYCIYGESGSYHIKNHHSGHDLDAISNFVILFITCFFFCITIKVIQKLKMRP